MQTASPLSSTAPSTGRHASTCSVARLNPLVQTRRKTRYNVPPAVCSTATREIATNSHDFSLGKTCRRTAATRTACVHWGGSREIRNSKRDRAGVARGAATSIHFSNSRHAVRFPVSLLGRDRDSNPFRENSNVTGKRVRRACLFLSSLHRTFVSQRKLLKNLSVPLLSLRDSVVHCGCSKSP